MRLRQSLGNGGCNRLEARLMRRIGGAVVPVLLAAIWASCLCQAQTAEVPIKPTLVNLQVDLETAEDAQYVMPLLELIESYGWYTTVYVTGEFALQYPDLVKQMHDRGHQIGVGGWCKDEDLDLLSHEEAYDTVENAFLAVRAAVGDMRPAYIADFKPQGYQVTEALLDVLARLEVRSCTGVFSTGPDHPHHLEQFGVVAIPLPERLQSGDGCACSDDGLILADDEYVRAGKSIVEFFADLRTRYDANRRGFRPFAAAVHPSITASEREGLEVARDFLDHLDATPGNMVVVDQLTVQANPFIDWIEIEAPDEARAGEEIPVTVRYYANCYCPWYYFRIYSCTEGWLKCGLPLVRGLFWESEWSESEFVHVGEHQFTFNVQLPIETANYEYRLVVVGQACHGGPCWPTYSETTPATYDAIDSTAVHVTDYRVTLLFVPVNWTGTQSAFDSAADDQVDDFVSGTPLASCSDRVLAEKLSVEDQNYTVNTCDGILEGILDFVNSLGIDYSQYDVVVGLSQSPPDPNGCPGGVSNTRNCVWLRDRPFVLAHELGHIDWDGNAEWLWDEYCSRDAGSSDARCNVGPGAADPPTNPLDSDPPCDCPADGGDDETGDPCCEWEERCWKLSCTYWDDRVQAEVSVASFMQTYEIRCGERPEADVDQWVDAENRIVYRDYHICCRGNKDESGGRCIMSASSQRSGFCAHCQAHLASLARLNCLATSPTSLSSESPAQETDRRVAILELLVHSDDAVTSRRVDVAVARPGPLPHPSSSGAYTLRLATDAGESLYSESFDIYFFVHGPVYEEGIPLGMEYDPFLLSTAVPFIAGMQSVTLHHKDQLIFSKELPLTTIRGTVTAGGTPVEGALVFARGPDFTSTRTDDEGRYVLSVTEPGPYSLGVQPTDPNHMPAYQTILVSLEQVYVVDFDLGVGGSIAGRVTDATGNPVTEVWIYPDVYEPPYYQVDDNGEYLIAGMEPGTHSISIAAPAYPKWHIYVNGQYVATSTSVVVDVALGETTQVDFSQRLGVLLNFEYPSQGAAEASGWTFSGLWHLATEGQCSVFSPNPTPFPSSTHAAHFCDPASGAYATMLSASLGSVSPQQRAKQAEASAMAEPAKSYGELITPEIPVSGETQVDLQFEHFREVEYYADGSYDKTYVQVQFDGGAWQTIWFLDSKTPSEKAWTEAGPNTVPVPSGASVMRIKFVFDSVDNYGNDGLGWLIDDISISGPEPVTLRIITQGLPAGTVDQAYSTSLSASGGAPPYTWSCTGLAPGLALDPASGTISGDPTTAGTYDITVTVTDAVAATASRQYQLQINPVEPPPVGVLFEEDFADAGGWTMSGLWHTTDALGCVDLAGYGAAAYYGSDDACDFDTGARTTGVLTSPVIDVTGAVAVQVRFDHLREVEPFGDGAYDLTLVEAKLGDGPWRVIWARDSTSPSTAAWEQVTTSSFATDGANSLQIRFVFDTVDQWANDFLGWLVDNVSVDSMPSGTPLSVMSVREAVPRGMGGRVEIFNAPNPVREDGTEFVVRGADASGIQVQVEVYNLAGTLVWEGQTAGNELPWDGVGTNGERLANGVYLYRISVQMGDAWLVSEIRKLVILR